MSTPKHRILVVDDDRFTRELFAIQLQQQGFGVVQAEDGKTALQQLQQQPVDLVITDVLMPNMDGYDLCQAIRQTPCLRALPVIFYTAHYLEKADEELALRLGVAHYLHKPLAERQLVEAIEEVLERSKLETELHQLADELDSNLTRTHHDRILHQLNLKLRQLEQTDRARRQQEMRYHNLLMAAPDAIVVLDNSGIITETNQAVDKLFGYPCGALQGQPIETLLPEGITEYHQQQRLLQASSHACMQHLLKNYLQARDKEGNRITVQISLGVLQLGREVTTTLIIRDMREQEAANQRILHLGQLYNMLSRCDHALVHAPNEQALLDDFCRQIATEGNFPLAWIGYAQQDSAQSVTVQAAAGPDRHRLAHLRSSWGDNPKGQSPLSRAIRTGQTQVALSPQQTEQPPHPKESRGRDYRCEIALPLKVAGRVIGALAIHSSQDQDFQVSEDLSLFKELATDLSYGISRQRAEVQRTAAEVRSQLFRRALEACNDGVMITDRRRPNGPITFVNQALLDISGYEEEELLGQSLTKLQSGDPDQPGLERLSAAIADQASASVQLKNYRKDGSMFWSETHLAPVLEGGAATHYIAICSDISQQVEYQRALEQQTNFDILTNLANRNLLRDRVQQAISHAKRRGNLVALLILDLDRFKDINDSLGHPQGDQVLKILARRFRTALRSGDTAARWGGDEFAFVLTDIHNRQSVLVIIEHLLACLEQTIALDSQQLICTASIGCSFYPDDGQEFDQLFKHAETAMYQAKKEPGSQFHFFESSLNQAANQRLTMEIDLRRAIEEQQLCLHYQPQYDVSRNLIIGVEALVRWQHPDQGLISPAQFIPIAEQTGLILPLGQWVLRQACQDYMAWQRPRLGLRLAVNVSNLQIRSARFIEQLDGVLVETGMKPECLELEITESLMLESVAKVAKTLHRIHQRGIALSIDDFGTGYSNLGYLQQFPFQTLKIDKSFVARLPDKSSHSLCRAIVSMGRALELNVIAEGVETRAQSKLLLGAGAAQQQGYLFSRPVTAEAIQRLLPP